MPAPVRITHFELGAQAIPRRGAKSLLSRFTRRSPSRPSWTRGISESVANDRRLWAAIESAYQTGKKGTTQNTLVAVDVSAKRGIGIGGSAATMTVAVGARLPLTVAVPKDAFPGSAATTTPKTTS